MNMLAVAFILITALAVLQSFSAHRIQKLEAKVEELKRELNPD